MAGKLRGSRRRATSPTSRSTPNSGDRSPLDTDPGEPAKYSFVRGVPAMHDVMVKYGDPPWSYVPVGIWYELQNSGSDDADRLGNYGLIQANELSKPSYPVFPSSSVTGVLVGSPQAP